MPFCTKCGTAVDGRFCPNCGNAMPPPPDAPAPSAAEQPAPPAPPAYRNPPPAPAKKSPWLWVLVGCAGLVVIVIAGLLATGLFVAHRAKRAGFSTELMKRNPGLAAARMIVAMNPNIEEVSVDEDRGLITLREKSTGKKVTLNFEDVKNGRIVFQGDNGESVSLGAGSSWNPPDWLPAPSGAKVESGTNVQGPDGATGVGSLTTSASVDDVLQYYEDGLKNEGLKVTRQVVSGDTAHTGVIRAEDAEGKRNVSVSVTSEGGVTRIVVTYSSKKK